MLKINIKNFNVYSVLSILFLIAGIGYWIYWIIRYSDKGIVYDIGIYSFSIIFIIAGIVGFILSLMDKKEEF